MLMILHGRELAMPGIEVDIFTEDADWWVLLLRRLQLPEVGIDTHIITGTSDNRRTIGSKPIYELGTSRAIMVLPGFHALTGSRSTIGRIWSGQEICPLNIIRSARK